MRTLTVEVKNNNALRLLHDLELNKVIRIVNEPETSSYALPGDSISINDFKKWIDDAEHSPVISLSDAKNKWEQKKKQLQKFTM